MKPSARELLLQKLAALRAMAEDTWYDAGQVKPRERMANLRCHACKTGPMFHPAHDGRCWVTLPGGDQCDCTTPAPDRAAQQDRAPG